MTTIKVTICLLLLGLVLPMLAQQSGSYPASTNVPPLINFSGTLTDINHKPLTGVVGVTYLLYKDQEGGAPLWMETQNVEPDAKGHYTVMLGSITVLPPDIFVAGEARWLGVQAQGQAEQPRVMLLSVPYALKAGDATTIGGLPPSAFVLAAPSVRSPTSAGAASLGVPPPSTTVTGTGTVDFLPLWDTTSDIISSVIFQSGSGSTAKIGINTTTPAFTLDVKGGEAVRGILSLPAAGTATATKGFNSQPQNLVASAFNSSTNKAANQTFQWQAEPSGNDTTTPSGTLNLLFGEGTAKPTETGLHIASNGQITFAAGQAFPGTGDGTITGVTAGTDLTGGGSSGTITLNLDTTKVPQLNTANTFTGNQTVNGNLSATGVVTGSSYQIGSSLFAYGSSSVGNVFLGFAGNTTMTGKFNVGSGIDALNQNTTGSDNAAIGSSALFANSTGFQNTAAGGAALSANTTGVDNTASGVSALASNTTGSNNTASGAGAGQTGDSTSLTGSSNTFLGAFADLSTGTLSNATAIGANAEVDANNAMVLGSILGVNGGNANTNVGIGTTTPQAPLDVLASGNNEHIFLGNVGCGVNNAGIVFGTTLNATCQTYAISGDTGGNTYVDAPGGELLLRISPNTNAVIIDTHGNTSILGNLSVSGTLSKGSGSFKIDHPLDPANKYLYHSFVESPDMMNVYNGNITTDKRGFAVVTLPDYFEALNRDFRYQLTVMGQFAQAIVAKEINRNRFIIRTSRPNVKVSWQVTGIRHDAYADAHRIRVEEEKNPQERGTYLHPELFGEPRERAVGYRALPSAEAPAPRTSIAPDGAS